MLLDFQKNKRFYNELQELSVELGSISVKIVQQTQKNIVCS
jgi:hypothetical protein